MEALINSSLNCKSTQNKKMSFLFCFVFNELQSLNMPAHPCAAEILNKSEFPQIATLYDLGFS